MSDITTAELVKHMYVMVTVLIVPRVHMALRGDSDCGCAGRRMSMSIFEAHARGGGNYEILQGL